MMSLMTLNQQSKIETYVIIASLMSESTSLAMSTSVLRALPGKLDIKRHSPSISIHSLSVVAPVICGSFVLCPCLVERVDPF